MSYESIRAAYRNAYAILGSFEQKEAEQKKNTLKVDDVSFKSMRKAQPVTLAPAELVAMASVGMDALDQEIARKTTEQRKNVETLKKLNTLKTEMAKHEHGLDEEGDDKRGGEGVRKTDYKNLEAAYQRALKELPDEYRNVASRNLSTMHESEEEFSITGDQAARMKQEIDSAINDIETRQQAEMAEINNLMSKRSNIIEMTKNINTALAGQQDFITKNAPR